MTLTLCLRPGRLCVCRLDPADPVPEWAASASFSSITRTPSELSVICREESVPTGVRCERGWRGLEVRGPLDFSQIGVLRAIADPLARDGVSLLAVSTFDTDWILVREENLTRAIASLNAAGLQVEND